MSVIAPNPYSPYADAERGKRHLFAIPVFMVEVPPQPGALLPTGCVRLAVVPNDVRGLEPGAATPDGVCELCVAAMRAGRPLEDSRPATACQQCQVPTRFGGLCFGCRRDKHSRWWAAFGDGEHQP